MEDGNKCFENCGQQFYLVTTERFNELVVAKQFLGIAVPDSLIEHIRKMLAWSGSHEGFQCALTATHIGPTKKFWLPILFFESEVGMIRVSIENARCDYCTWNGYIANPTSPYLFETLSDRFLKMKEAANYPCVPCPQCGAKFNRNAVWAGSQNSDVTVRDCYAKNGGSKA